MVPKWWMNMTTALINAPLTRKCNIEQSDASGDLFPSPCDHANCNWDTDEPWVNESCSSRPFSWLRMVSMQTGCLIRRLKRLRQLFINLQCSNSKLYSTLPRICYLDEIKLPSYFLLMLSWIFACEFAPWELGMEEVRFFKLKLHQPMHSELPNMLYRMSNRNTYKARKDGSTWKVYDASGVCGHQLRQGLGVPLQSPFHALMWRGWKASSYIVDAPLQVGLGVQWISAIWCTCVERGRWKWDGSSLSEASAGLPGRKGRNVSAAHARVYSPASCVSSNSHGVGNPLASLSNPRSQFREPTCRFLGCKSCSSSDGGSRTRWALIQRWLRGIPTD